MSLLFWFASSIILIQLSYWVFFYFSLTKKINLGPAKDVPVSVIVCAHDEEQNLRELIPLLLSQNHAAFEIIIVDDRSNDGTYDLLLTETKNHPTLKMIHINLKPNHVNGKKYALTLGIKAARYDWVLLTDADCRPNSGEWIGQMANAFIEKTSIVLGYSPYRAEPGLLNAFIRFETMLTAIQYFSFAMSGFPYMGVGRNLAYRKNLFLDNKGFNGHISVTGGDDDLFVNQHANSQNVSLVVNEKATVFSKAKTNWKEFFQQKLRHLSVGKYYTVKTKLILAPFSISMIFFWPIAFASLFSSLWYWALAAMLLRWMFQLIVAFRFSAMSHEKFNPFLIPLVDIIFWFYYLVTGLSALATKRIKWKT